MNRRNSLKSLVAAAACAVISASGANVSAAPNSDPIVGDWNVTYGAPATVELSQWGGEYTETAKTPVRVTGASCDIPAETVTATFKQTGRFWSSWASFFSSPDSCLGSTSC